MRPINTEQTELSHKEWQDLILAQAKGKGRSRYYSAICPICLVSYDVDILSSDASARALAVEKVASHIRSAHSDELTWLTSRDVASAGGSPSTPMPEYCPRWTRVDIENKGAPSARVGKSLDLILSFCTFDLFAWPAALYLILENNAEFAFFQVPFNVRSKFIQTRILTDPKDNIKELCGLN